MRCTHQGIFTYEDRTIVTGNDRTGIETVVLYPFLYGLLYRNLLTLGGGNGVYSSIYTLNRAIKIDTIIYMESMWKQVILNMDEEVCEMDRKEMKKTRKILATLLTFAMVLGIFVGTDLPVRAEETVTLNFTIPELHVGDTFISITQSQSLIDSAQNFNNDGKMLLGEIAITTPNSGGSYEYGGQKWDMRTDVNSQIEAGKTYGLMLLFGYQDTSYNLNNLSKIKINGNEYPLIKYFPDRDTVVFVIIDLGTPQSDNDTGNSSTSGQKHESTKKNKDVETTNHQETVHEHSYSWVTVQEAGVGQDGIEEYRCSCGAVADRSVIPATQAAVSGMMDAVQNAPAGGNISFDSGRFYTMSDKIIKKLAERSDVVTEITFEYQGIAYKMTVPAGIDYTAILADDECFYGYFYFAQLIGATIETR